MFVGAGSLRADRRQRRTLFWWHQILIWVGSRLSLGVDTLQVIVSSQSGVNGPVAPWDRRRMRPWSLPVTKPAKAKRDPKYGLECCYGTDESVWIHKCYWVYTVYFIFNSLLFKVYWGACLRLIAVLQERLFVVIFNQHSQKCLKMLEMFENDKCLKTLAFGKCQHVTGGCF